VSRVLPIPGSPVTNRIAPAPSRAARARSRVSASLQSPIPPHDRSLIALDPSGGHRRCRRGEDGSRADGSGLPLELELLRRPPLEKRFHAFEGLLADENRAGIGEGLEPGGDVHGVTHGAVLNPRTGADGAHQDGSGFDADPDAESVDLPASPDLLGEVRHLLDDPEGSQQGALGVVLVRHRSAEEGEHAVAGQILHGAAERLDGTDDPPDRVSHHELELLRLQSFPKRGGSHEVGEERGHETSLLAHGRS
jgi:hypothetical protein